MKLCRHAWAYFLFVFAISYGAFLVVVGPNLLHGRGETAAQAEYILFPVLVFGVFLTSILLTGGLEGRAGLKRLFAGQRRWRAGVGWYAIALLVCPGLMLAVIFALRWLDSPVFRRNEFFLGITFAIVPGFLEEYGWMGFAYPHMRKSMPVFRTAIVLGILWGFWHAPVVDYLGAAAPHRQYWLPFFLAFVAIVAAVRVLIVWLYDHTGSLPLTQLTHVSLTGSLVMLDPVRVTAGQETLWYAIYALVLWTVVLICIRPRLVEKATPGVAVTQPA